MTAASIAVRPALAGPVRRGRVLAVLPGAVHVEDAGGRLLALLSPRAVRLPIGVVLPAASWPAGGVPGPGPRAGTQAWIGDGAVRVAGQTWRVARWWDPRVPRLGRLTTAALSVLAAHLPPPPVEVAEPTAALAAALGRASSAGQVDAGELDGVVGALVGLGPGLTPAGDDVLAGALATLTAFGAQRLAEALARQVRFRMPATTVLSAALLDRACAGEAVPELTGLLRACAGSGAPPVGGAVAALGRVGHTSGTALGHGALAALRAAASARVEAA